MEFKDIFREKYRTALLAARDHNQEATLNGLMDLSNLFSEQFKKKNGDPIVIKAKLKYWQETFEKYVAIIRKYGLYDRRIQKLFGLVDDEELPSISDIMKGDSKIDVPEQVNESVDIEGIVPNDSEEEHPEEGIVPNDSEEKHPVEEVETIPTPVEEILTPLVPEDDTKSTKEPDKKPSYDPTSLKDFIGQAHIVKALSKEIAIAKNEGRKHLDNILLFGNPGLGKTTLMKLIADELGVKFELLDCSQFRNSQQSLKALQNFFMRIARDNEPVVIALDEVHMLTTELQSSLLTLLNNRVYVSPLDVNGQCKRIPIDEFTFIAATTDDDKVLDTIKNRCLRLTFQLVDYTFEELKQIYQNKVAAKGLTITEEAIDTCIPRSRGAIRYVNSIVDGLNNALYDDEGKRVSTNIDLNIALSYFEEKGIDSIGLDKKDIEILKVIEEETSGTISADVLSARVGLETKKYLSEYERYLIKIGFISVSGRGRSLTEKAIKYLKGE